MGITSGSSVLSSCVVISTAQMLRSRSSTYAVGEGALWGFVAASIFTVARNVSSRSTDLRSLRASVMRLAIVTDIHGNLLALEAVVADIRCRGVDQVVNVGDSLSGPLLPLETART